MSEPTEAIKKRKQERQSEKKHLKQDMNKLKDDIKGNPKVVEEIRKLERRVELLEEKVD